ncbi:hypothetical protein R1flu_015448 [Riccia fluitans]|uniref:Tetratricopeptide repeat protein 1 n=1 Tax=Riccia fluitans TaxID=41844 RepID=A0ABD1YM40_9MARC
MAVIREEEEEEIHKATASSTKRTVERDQIEEDRRVDHDRCSSSGGAEELGKDAEDEGWETASEGGDEFQEVTDVDPDAEPHASDQMEELESKLRQVDLEQVRKQAVDAANTAKAEGNVLYGEKRFVEALQAYDQGLSVSELKESDEDPVKEIKEIRAILYCNRAACYMGLDNNDAAIRECTKALELNPEYVKALVRRAQAREKLTFYEEAMADWNKVLEIEPGMSRARTSLRQLAPLAEEKREKLKAEMLSKLKEAGNSILGRFGMSIDNFKTVQDPNTGAYSIQFQR